MKEYVLNETRFQFDERGFLKGIAWKGNAFMTRGAGLFDLAQPVKYDYENIRLEPDNAVFAQEGDTLTVTYESLCPDILVPELAELEGGVSAVLTLRALSDGCSVSMQLKVTNHAKAVVRQIMFPFFKGLDAMDGEYETRFTTLGFNYHPFRELNDIPQRRTYSFAGSPVVAGRCFESGGYAKSDNMIGRYYDYGSLQRGFSLYHRHWGAGPDEPGKMADTVHMRLMQDTRLLWIGNIHPVYLEQGQCYESKEYVFTPHTGGWENGIGPYKAWVDQNKKRKKPLPDSMRNALGFRSIWMMQAYPNDPDSIAWKFEDLPKIGEDMAEHGLKEVSIWGQHPLLTGKEVIGKNLGGFERYREAIEKLHALGVNPAAFVSYVSIWRENMERYGLKPGRNAWNQVIKAIPAMNPPYLERDCAAYVDQSNELWKSDVKRALRFLRDELGIHSIGWDQYYMPNGNGGVTEILNEYSGETAKLYPDFTLHAESTNHFEEEIACVDYTWNWAYPDFNIEGGRVTFPRDNRPYQHVVETTRLNINIDNNPLDVKRCFAENVLMNIMPSKGNHMNGSALIKDYPEFSAALKQAAKLREKYLRFFRNGVPVGDCVLDKEAAGLRVSGYRMPEETLVMIFAPARPLVMRQEGEFEEDIVKKSRACRLQMSSVAAFTLAESFDFDRNEWAQMDWKDGCLSFEIKEGELLIALFRED